MSIPKKDILIYYYVCFHSFIHVRKSTFTDEFIIEKQKKQTFHTFFDRIESMNE